MHGLKNISVKAKFMMLTSIFVIGTTVFGALSYMTINAVKIDGSPVQHKIADLKTMRADYLPPQASLLPTNFFLYRMLLSTNPQDIEKNKAKVLELFAEFQKQRQFWMDETTDASMKELLTKAYEPADKYIDAVQNQIFPLVAAGKMPEANQTRHDVTAKLFDLHEKAIAHIDALSTQQLLQAEVDAANENSRRIML